jgi:hypothetical protein
MNKQELIKEFREVEIYSLNIFGTEIKAIPTEIAITSIEQLDEQKPVKVPQFVAEIIEYYKKQNATLYDALREKNFNKQYNEWLMNEQDAYNKVARAWLDGYEVEEEKRYRVKIKEEIKENLLVYGLGIERYFFTRTYDSSKRGEHTRKELEEAGFGWVFDCEGVEVEEVKDEHTGTN